VGMIKDPEVLRIVAVNLVDRIELADLEAERYPDDNPFDRMNRWYAYAKRLPALSDKFNPNILKHDAKIVNEEGPFSAAGWRLVNYMFYERSAVASKIKDSDQRRKALDDIAISWNVFETSLYQYVQK